MCSSDLAKGEWWRVLSSMFLHIGVIHFALNNLGLKIVGRFIEQVTGGYWFLAIYIFAGILGNLVSTFVNVSLGIGAGASGAIFGLVGAGLVFEMLAEWKRYKSGGAISIEGDVIDVSPRKKHSFKLIPGPFSFMIILNIALAVGLNIVFSTFLGGSIRIDNANHFGGLLGGILLTSSLLCLRPNRLLAPHKFLGVSIIVLSLLATSVAWLYLAKSHFIKNELINIGLNAKDFREKLGYLSGGIEIDPQDPLPRYYRGIEFLKSRNFNFAKEDLQFVVSFPFFKEKLIELKKILQKQEDFERFSIIKQVLERDSTLQKF